MPAKANPLSLNPLQLRTLALLQAMARLPGLATPLPDTGAIFLAQIPHPHGDHFHIGERVVAARDASGLQNPSVWAALERKGLVKGNFPFALTLTKEGLEYDTAPASGILREGGHH